MPTTGEPEVVLDSVSRIFPAGARERTAHAAVSDVSLTVHRGEIVVFIGPSGCGKSTTLRMVAGLEEPDRGQVTIAGRSMRGVPPQERDVAMVFQGYALYPQMTARQIMEFPLKMRKVPKDERAKAVEEAAAMLGLTRLLDRRPDQMSGGERQRVAMGRAIVRKPRVFLFDEPLSNIDPALRAEIRLEIGTLVRRLGATALYVTHDHVEAMTLGDRIALMRGGRLLQCATPRVVYEKPAAEFVGAFVGSPKMNVLDGEVRDGVLYADAFRLAGRDTQGLPAKVRVGVRPEDVRLAKDDSAEPASSPGGSYRDDAGARVVGEVIAVEPLGAETHLVVKTGETVLRAREHGFDTHARGDRVRIAIDPARVHLFDPARDGQRV